MESPGLDKENELYKEALTRLDSIPQTLIYIPEFWYNMRLCTIALYARQELNSRIDESYHQALAIWWIADWRHILDSLVLEEKHLPEAWNMKGGILVTIGLALASNMPLQTASRHSTIWKQAIKCFSKAISLRKDDEWAYFHKCKILQLIQRNREAKRTREEGFSRGILHTISDLDKGWAYRALSIYDRILEKLVRCKN